MTICVTLIATVQQKKLSVAANRNLQNMTKWE